MWSKFQYQPLITLIPHKLSNLQKPLIDIELLLYIRFIGVLDISSISTSDFPVLIILLFPRYIKHPIP